MGSEFKLRPQIKDVHAFYGGCSSRWRRRWAHSTTPP
jgi:hypothetical protein